MQPWRNILAKLRAAVRGVRTHLDAPSGADEPDVFDETPPVVTPSPWPSDMVDGRYRVLEQLGSGGLARVYLALDTKLGRRVALKFLEPGPDVDTVVTDSFRREVQALSDLHHPNVVVVHDFEDTPHKRYIVSEYVSGDTVRKRLEAGARIPLSEALNICRQAATGVAAAHRAGIVHRDLKPENIIIQPDHCVKVLDFGLAKHRRSSNPGPLGSVHTGTGNEMGTLPYMAPEQIAGGLITPECDVWSLGVILYELACGRHPFHAPTSDGTIARINRAEIPEMPSDIPSSLQRVLRMALASDPDKRYRTALPMSADLEMVVPASFSPAGKWTAAVKYGQSEISESFHFETDGEEVQGTATFRGEPRPLLQGSFKGNRLRFLTKTTHTYVTTDIEETFGAMGGFKYRDVSKKVVERCRYRGKLTGDEIHFVLIINDETPVKFIATRAE